MVAQSDNCEGVLKIITGRQTELKGNLVKHKETMPTFRIEGTLEEIITDNDRVTIIANWEKEGMEKAFYSLDGLSVDIERNSIIFGIAGLRTFAGETTIFV
jgi:hypothetical protein